MLVIRSHLFVIDFFSILLYLFIAIGFCSSIPQIDIDWSLMLTPWLYCVSLVLDGRADERPSHEGWLTRVIPQQETKDPSAAKIFAACMPTLAKAKYVLSFKYILMCYWLWVTQG